MPTDVKKFKEKPQVTSGWINGGYFISKNKFLNFIKGDKTILEKDPLEIATKRKQLMAFQHKKFWKCVDTKRDKDVLDNITSSFSWLFKVLSVCTLF